MFFTLNLPLVNRFFVVLSKSCVNIDCSNVWRGRKIETKNLQWSLYQVNVLYCYVRMAKFVSPPFSFDFNNIQLISCVLHECLLM